MVLDILRKGLLCICLAAPLSVCGQDLIANQPPDLIANQPTRDRRLKMTDSVSMHYLRHQSKTTAAKELYPEMDNRSVHNYKDIELPDSFRIDLRHFVMPTTSTRITSNFGYRPAFRRVHQGIDIKVYTGDTIVSAYSGIVRITKYEARGYGKYVVVRHDNGLETVYGHLSKQLVQEGQRVKAGEPIGLGGNTGHSTGSHLHFEILFLGKVINPSLLFDFQNQDVTADFFTFYKTVDYGRSTSLLAKNDDTNKIQDITEKAVGIKYHKVTRGESLYAIARKLGTTVDRLCSLNRITTRSKLRLGQILRYEVN